MKTQLQHVCGFAARRSPLNILNTVRITEKFCYATDHISSMRIAIDGPKLDMCVDAGMLKDLLAGFPDDQQISITEGKDHIVIQGGRRKLKLRTVQNDGMPEIEAGGNFHEMDPAAVATGLKFATAAASTRNVAQPALTNVLINMTPTGTFVVATDGARLHAYKIDDKASEHNIECLVPRQLALRLANMCEIGGVLKVNRHRVVYEKGDAVFISTISGVPFPPWQRIVPPTDIYDCQATVNPKALASMAEGAARLGAEFVELKASDGVVTVFADQKGDQFDDSMEADVVGNGDSMLRHNYLTDALHALGYDKPVTIHIPSDALRRNRPVLFTNGTDHICFAMGFKS